MSEELKKGWCVWRFDQMATMVNDRIDDPAEANVEYYVGLEHLDPESLTIRRWGSPSDVNATKLLFRKGDIIFGRRRVYQRKLAVAHFDGICSAHALVLRAKPEVVVPEFLPFFMQSDLFMERAKQISVGSLSPTINWKTLAKEEFALPPMEEQINIFKALHKAELLICALLETKANVYNLLRSIREEVIAKYYVSGENTTIELSEWKKEKIENIATVIFSNVDKKTNKNEEVVRLCNYMDVYSGGYITNAMDFMKATASINEIKKFTLMKGDVLITKDSETPLDIGVSAIVTEDIDNVLCGYHLAIIRPKKNILSSYFLWLLLKTNQIKKYYFQMAGGVTRFGLTTEAIRKMPIILPPIDVQDRIASRYKHCYESHTIITKRLNEALIMKENLIGEILIPHS